MGFLPKRCLALLFTITCLVSPAQGADGAIRVKDLGKMQGWRDNPLVGYGLVTGLAGTGDSPNNRASRQALSNALTGLDLSVSADQLQSRNVAVVLVSATLPAFARAGDALDLTVTSAGDARSLAGGSLLLTPLKGANGRIYALGQGSLSVGGYRYDANGNVVQKNHPTTAAVPGGATVEVGVSAEVMASDNSVTFVLAEPDYTTAQRVAQAINSQLGSGLAEPRDAAGVAIAVPQESRAHLVNFLARIENVTVHPDRRARVVINERTGTVVAGGDVRIDRVAISVGDLKIAIATQNSVSQPLVFGNPGSGVRTAIVRNSEIRVDEQAEGYVAPGDTTVADLVHTLARMKTSTRDVISVLRAVKAAGAMHAELVIQ
jgi:flagellar P-ring protein precursor FlgI